MGGLLCPIIMYTIHLLWLLKTKVNKKGVKWKFNRELSKITFSYGHCINYDIFYEVKILLSYEEHVVRIKLVGKSYQNI